MLDQPGFIDWYQFVLILHNVQGSFIYYTCTEALLYVWMQYAYEL